MLDSDFPGLAGNNSYEKGRKLAGPPMPTGGQGPRHAPSTEAVRILLTKSRVLRVLDASGHDQVARLIALSRTDESLGYPLTDGPAD